MKHELCNDPAHMNVDISKLITTNNDKSETVNCIYRPVEELHSARCPHCGESYYMENYTTTTCMHYPPIYKNGANINPDRNKSTAHCTCMNCRKNFTISK